MFFLFEITIDNASNVDQLLIIDKNNTLPNILNSIVLILVYLLRRPPAV